MPISTQEAAISIELKAETQRVLVVSGHQPDERPVKLMPIKQLFKLQSCVRDLYPDASVAIRPNGDLELEFSESFHEEANLSTLHQQVKTCLREQGYKV